MRNDGRTPSAPAALRARRAIAAGIAIVLAAAVMVATEQSPAHADSAPPSSAIPTTVSSDPLPTPQIDGVVWDQEIVGDTVFVGGSFSTARPAGAAPGASTVPRTFLLSYRLSTGVLTNWAPVLNGQVNAIDASPDGSRIYVGGAFTQVNGSTRNRIVAFDAATGAVIPTFAASANGEVFAVDSTASTVYFAGNFSQSAGVSRPGRAAAASAATGATTAWAPVIAQGRAYGLVVSPDGSKVVIGGSFTTLNGSGNPGYGLGAVTSTTGTSLPFAANSTVRNAGTDSAIFSLSADGDSIYGTGYIFGTGGNLEGTFRASWDGSLVWAEDCHGDTYSAAAANGVVYTAGHAHYCGNLGGFPERSPRLHQHAVAFTKVATGVATRDVNGYPSWTGVASPSVLTWFPEFSMGSYTGMYQGPWSVQTDGRYVVYGGEFPRVNGAGQQGLVRFAIPTIAPNRDGPRLSGSSWPISAVSRGSGEVAITWPANYDRDNGALRYLVIRGGDVQNPIAQRTSVSNGWDRGGLGFVDRGLTPGSTQSYRIRAVDPFGNVADSATVQVTVSGSGSLGEYARTIIGSNPTWYYRLGESSGNAINVAGPVANVNRSGATAVVNASVGSGATRGRPGAIAGDADRAMAFGGSSSSRIVSSASTWGDDSLTVEAWFRTSSSSGKIVGFGDSGSTSTSGTVDRHLFLDGGRVAWGVNDGSNRILRSGTGYANGAWHHAVGTVGPDGQKLYVDGVLVAQDPGVVKGWRYWGYVHIGGDRAWAGSTDFTGDIDEVAIYSDVLAADAVLQHYRIGTGAGASNLPPTASFTTSATGLTVAVDARASTDPDGTIASYAWTFGDGATASGATASRSYATAGTYTVTLRVTDDDGATATTTRQVTVAATPPPPPPPPGSIAEDDFTRTVASGWGSASVGGSWSAGGANYAVTGGVATALHTPGATRRAVLSNVATTTVDVQVVVALDKAPAGGACVVGVVGRQVGSAFYQARLRITPDGVTRLELVNGSTTVLAWQNLTNGPYTAGRPYTIRMVATGTQPTTLRAKAWPTGTTEPAAWQLTTTDATAGLQTAGSVGVESYLSGSASNAPVTVRFDAFRAVTAQ